MKVRIILFTCLITIGFIVYQLFFSKISLQEVDGEAFKNNSLSYSFSSQSYGGSLAAHLSSQGARSSNSSYSVSFKDNVIRKNSTEAWVPLPSNQADIEKIGSLIGYGQVNSAYQFIQINVEYLDSLKQGDIFEMQIPGSNPIDVAITSVTNIEDARSIVGHLSNFSDAYYIGINYDKNGNAVGEITTEKENYAIRTHLNKTVVYKVIIDPEKYKRDDF